MPLENTAIQPDVEVKDQEQTISPRNAMLAEIAAKAKEERDRELADNGHEVVDTSKAPKEVKEEEKAEEEADEEVSAETDDKEVVEEKKPEPDFVEIKVDGEIRKVEKEKIVDAGIRALQKESTADKRLEEATRLLREVQTKYAAPQADSPSQWDDETVEYAIQHGDEQQKAYAEQLKKERQAAIPDQIAARVMSQIEAKSAAEWFANEFKDIVEDPYLFRLAVEAENDALKAGDTRPHKERFKQFGETLRAWKGGSSTQDGLAQKQEHKAQKVVSLQTASVKKSAPQEPKPKTTSDKIEEMRKARGQR